MSETVASLAADLLLAVRRGDAGDAERLAARIAELDVATLAVSLPGDAERIATWLNLYNAAAQRLMEASPGIYPRRWQSFGRFFRRPALVVAGRSLNLDAIEHGILRRSRWKLGLGWLGNPLPGSFERRLRVSALDPRIHFALNCVATSCPPISVYRAAHLDGQLELATRAYLAASVRRERDRVVVPRVFLWFLGDFGGPRGVRRFLSHHGFDPRGRRIRYERFDWAPRPAAWAAEDDPPGD